MGKKRKRVQLTEDEIWDDSALLRSWQDALDEYQVNQLRFMSYFTDESSSITASMLKERMSKAFCARQNLTIMPRRKRSDQRDLRMAMLHPIARWKMEKSMNRTMLDLMRNTLLVLARTHRYSRSILSFRFGSLQGPLTLLRCTPRRGISQNDLQ